MRKWELWQGSDGQSFFPETNSQAREEAKRAGYHLVWHCLARGSNSAAQMMYDHLGWGKYEPMRRADGTPYPEDEDEDDRPQGTDQREA